MKPFRNTAIAALAAVCAIFSTACNKTAAPPQQTQAEAPASAPATQSEPAAAPVAGNAAPAPRNSALPSGNVAANKPAPGAGAAAGNPARNTSTTTQAVAPAAPVPPPPPPLKTATLAAGTPISVRTTTSISSKTEQSGNTFTATLESPITHGDWLIAKKGATVTGRIVESDAGGRVKGKATITLQLTSLSTADGQRIPLSTSAVTHEAKGSVKKDAAKVGIGAGIGAAIGAIAGGGKGAAIGAGVGGAGGTAVVLGTKGDAAVIPPETVLNFELRGPVTVTEKR